MSRLAGLAVVALAWHVVPLLYLISPNFWGAFTVFCSTFAAVALLWTKIIPFSVQPYIKPLGAFRYPSNIIDGNSIAPISYEVSRELAQYSALTQKGGRDPKAIAFIKVGNSRGRWKGHSRLFTELSAFLSKVPPANLLLHSNTTEAIAHVIERLNLTSEDHLLFTDMEYGTVKRKCCEAAMADSLASAVPIEVYREHLSGNADGGEILSRYIKKAREIIPTLRGSKGRLIVVCTHVYHQTGATLDVAKLRQLLCEACAPEAGTGPRVLLLVDGAQAVGNIHVDSKALAASDFYAFSGHKWLCCEASIGIMVVNRSGLETRALWDSQQIEAFLKSDRPFSSIDVTDQADSSTSGLRSQISLGIMLSEFRHVTQEELASHGLELAKLFYDSLPLYGLSTVQRTARPPECGIVTLRVPNASHLERKLQAAGVSCSVVTHSAGSAESEGGFGLIRFTFPYMKEEDSVYEALERLAASITLLDATAYA